MKLPNYDAINDDLDNLFVIAAELSQPHMHGLPIEEVCNINIELLTEISNLSQLLRLELEAIMKEKI